MKINRVQPRLEGASCSFRPCDAETQQVVTENTKTFHEPAKHPLFEFHFVAHDYRKNTSLTPADFSNFSESTVPGSFLITKPLRISGGGVSTGSFFTVNSLSGCAAGVLDEVSLLSSRNETSL